MYQLARFVANILSVLIGKSKHHITNTQSFVEQLLSNRDLKLNPDESLVSFDVSALFTSIPVDKTLDIVRELLNKDNTWRKDAAESLDTDTVIKLLSFCLTTTYFVFKGDHYQLTTTYFVFKGDHYQQKDGCAMRSPYSPLVANAYMEHFEQLALSSALHRLASGIDLWKIHSVS